MTSKLGCIGLAVDTGDQLDRLVAAVLPAADSLGRNGDLEVFRWQDPSGARLIIGIEDGERVDLLASFAGASGPVLAHLRPVAAEVTAADVVDRDGDQLARIAVELEQRRLLMAAPSAPSGPATLVALGTDVTVREDPDAVETFRSRAGPGSAQAQASAEASAEADRSAVRRRESTHVGLRAGRLPRGVRPPGAPDTGTDHRRNGVAGGLARASPRYSRPARAQEVRLAPRLTARSRSTLFAPGRPSG